MLHLTSAGSARRLAVRLAEVLGQRPIDPMEEEWLAVPSEGMRRWLTLELARSLGASTPGGGDGVTANIARALPGSLRGAVLQAGRPDPQSDPWAIDRLVWSVLSVAQRQGDDPELAGPFTVVSGGSAYAKARRIADLFDRYHLHRPDMIRSWAAGRSVDGSGERLRDHHAWQPRLWRLLRAEVSVPSPPEQLPDLLARVRSGELELDLPGRLLLFGFSTLPGAGFLEIAQAVGTRREVHLFLLEPHAFDATRLVDAFPPPARDQPRLRADDPTADLVVHPLLRSWGRLPRETALLFADARAGGLAAPEAVGPLAGHEAPSSLLGRLQQAIATNSVGEVRPDDPGDRSIQLHACYGPMRQVEVARDALLHLLDDAESGLTEEDILVLTPDLDRFAPLIGAVFGSSPSPEVVPSAPDDPIRNLPPGAPGLRYRIADQSMRSVNPVLGATAALLDLVSGRCSGTDMLAVLALTPVRQRFGLDDDGLAVITEWVAETQVRWGLDPTHRSLFGVPEAITSNSWRAALDRLLIGSAVQDDSLELAVGGVAPFGVEGSDIEVLGRLAEFLSAVADLEAESRVNRPVGQWIALVLGTCERVLAAPRGASWQFDALRRILGEILEASSAAGPEGAEPSEVPLTFVDLRRLLDEQLRGESGRPDFFRGGVTVSSMTPLRWVPYRVICLLGVDQTAFGAPAAAADDLIGLAPFIGDRDARAEARQSLLEAVLAAGDHLVVVRDGRDIRTSHPVPRPVVIAELVDAVLPLVPPADRSALDERLETHHPRHPFDEDCFVEGRLQPGTVWGFSEADRAGAQARRHRSDRPVPFLDHLLDPVTDPVVDLADLRSFLVHPVQAFVRQALGVALSRSVEPVPSELPVSLTALEHSSVGRRLLDLMRNGGSVEAWAELEEASGTLPVGVLRTPVLDELVGTVGNLVVEAGRRGVRSGPAELVEVDLQLDGDTRLVGEIPLALTGSASGPARLQFTRMKPAHRLEAWLDLMVLVATDPSRTWRSLVVGRDAGSAIEVIDLVPSAIPDAQATEARRALQVAVDCYRRGMREPLPLFPTLSRQVYEEKASSEAWSGHEGRGDANDRAVAVAFDGLSYDEVMRIEARPDDPPGSGRRVRRYADYLWGAVSRSVVDAEPPTDPDSAAGADRPPDGGHRDGEP